MYYFKKVLAQILEGEQPELENVIRMYFENYEQSFEDLTIADAIKFLRRGYEF